MPFLTHTALSILSFHFSFPDGVAAEEVNGFGVTPSLTAVSDGWLTASISTEGKITGLRWPNATFYEHVAYKTENWAADNVWLKPFFGAKANDGLFSGVVYGLPAILAALLIVQMLALVAAWHGALVAFDAVLLFGALGVLWSTTPLRLWPGVVRVWRDQSVGMALGWWTAPGEPV